MYCRFKLSYSTLLAIVAVPIVRSTHGRNFQAQFDSVGKGGLETALDGGPDFVGEPVCQFERDQDLVSPVPYEWHDAQRLLGLCESSGYAREKRDGAQDNEQETCRNGPHHAVGH